MRFSLDMYDLLDDLMTNLVGEDYKVEICVENTEIIVTFWDVNEQDLEAMQAVVEEQG